MSKYYVLEWFTEEHLVVTPSDSAEDALNKAQASLAQSHCVSTVNPLEESK